jgi:outer membrane lipoprotein LolB
VTRSAFGAWRWVSLIAIIFIAGCAQFTSVPGTFDAQIPHWVGRLSVKVHSDPVQTLSAQFELQGSVENGILVLTSPLGTTLARILWSPQDATLQVATEVQRFDSLDTLTRHVAGTELPVLSLFSWLDGKSTESPGWSLDLQDLATGRLAAHRFAPAPAADLKIILER